CVRKQLGYAPIDDQSLAKSPEHDVLGLEVAMHDPPAMRISNRIAGVNEPTQQPAEFQIFLAGRVRHFLLSMKSLNRLFECFAFDQPHRIEGPAVAMSAQPVNRHDSRMLEPAGDPGLTKEPRLTVRIIGVKALKLFECDLTIQLGIQS